MGNPVEVRDASASYGPIKPGINRAAVGSETLRGFYSQIIFNFRCIVVIRIWQAGSGINYIGVDQVLRRLEKSAATCLAAVGIVQVFPNTSVITVRTIVNRVLD